MALDKHFTATTYILSSDKKETLLHFHDKLRTWLPPGGHIEQNETPLEAAIREIVEETAILPDKLVFIQNGEDPKKLDERAEMLFMPHYLLSELIEEGHYHLDWIFYAKINPKDFDPTQRKELFKWFTLKDLEEEGEIFTNVRELAKKGIVRFT